MVWPAILMSRRTRKQRQRTGWPCNISKKLKTKQTLGKHMDKFHAEAENFSNQVRNFLLSPIPGPDVPLGSSPSTAPASGLTATPNVVPRPRQSFCFPPFSSICNHFQLFSTIFYRVQPFFTIFNRFHQL
jgi:hypothetical protein